MSTSSNSVDVPIYGALLTLTLVIILGVFACLVICLVFCLVGCMRRHAIGLFSCLDSPNISTNSSGSSQYRHQNRTVVGSSDLFDCLAIARRPRCRNRNSGSGSYRQRCPLRNHRQYVAYWTAPCGESLASCLPSSATLLEDGQAAAAAGSRPGRVADHFVNCAICSAFIFGVDQPTAAVAAGCSFQLRRHPLSPTSRPYILACPSYESLQYSLPPPPPPPPMSHSPPPSYAVAVLLAESSEAFSLAASCDNISEVDGHVVSV